MAASRRARIGLAIAVAAVACTAAGLAWRRHAHSRAEREAWMHDAPRCAQAIPLGETCGRCVAAFCCAEITACYARSDCIDLNDCTIECGEDERSRAGESREACRARCASKHPSASAAFAAWEGCVRRSCERECPRGEDD